MLKQLHRSQKLDTLENDTHMTEMHTLLANMRRFLLLAQRLRRWPNSKPTLGQHLMFAGMKQLSGSCTILCYAVLMVLYNDQNHTTQHLLQGVITHTVHDKPILKRKSIVRQYIT